MQKMTNEELLKYFDTCVACPISKEDCKKECGIQAELLRRLNERDELEKENEVLREQNFTMNKTISEARKEVESLKCCGNCSQKFLHKGNNWCRDWQSDNLTREERKK
ncbi:MAG: hypothetical protein A4E71_02926 [Smithella sp. PtaU1.Bin162]|nr:MAG: hypothetical protein A4E71_02926 [Smithella sp. PtaU1.Bin162]